MRRNKAYLKAIEIAEKDPAAAREMLEKLRLNRQQLTAEREGKRLTETAKITSVPEPARTSKGRPAPLPAVTRPKRPTVEEWQAVFDAAVRAQSQMQFEEGVKGFRQAAKLAAQLDGEQLDATYRQWVNHAQANRKFDHAEEVLRAWLVSTESRFGPDSLPVSEVLRDLGVHMAFLIEGKEEGIELLKRALAIRDGKLRTRRDTVTLHLLQQIGTAHRLAGRFDTAEQQFQEVVTLKREMHGDGADLHSEMDALRAVYVDQGNFEKAAKITSDLLASLEKKYGSNHKILLGTLYSYAEILRKMGRGSEAHAVHARWEALNKN